MEILLCVGRHRGSHQRCSMKKGVLTNSVKFKGKHLPQSLFLNKVAGLRLATLLKKRLWHRCFPVNLAKFLRAPFLQNTSVRLLLRTVICKFNYRYFSIFNCHRSFMILENDSNTLKLEEKF